MSYDSQDQCTPEDKLKEKNKGEMIGNLDYGVHEPKSKCCFYWNSFTLFVDAKAHQI